jgi:Flp pilus assembly protein TadD
MAEGEALLAAEDRDGAVSVFQKVVALSPSSALAHSKLGIAYAHRRQWEDALAEFSRAIQLDPRYAPAHSNLGNVYRERGHLDQAVACYQKAIAVDPEYWVAHQNLGVVYKQQGRLGDAVHEFKTATRLSLRSSPGTSSRLPPRGARSRLGCLGASSAVLLLVAALAQALSMWQARRP